MQRSWARIKQKRGPDTDGSWRLFESFTKFRTPEVARRFWQFEEFHLIPGDTPKSAPLAQDLIAHLRSRLVWLQSFNEPRPQGSSDGSLAHQSRWKSAC